MGRMCSILALTGRRVMSAAKPTMSGGRGKTAAMLLVLAAVCISACHRRPLEDPNYRTEIRIRIDDSNISNVTCDIYNESLKLQRIEPEVMHVLFYDSKTGVLAAENYISRVTFDENGDRIISGEIQLVPGDYSMLAYDFGTEDAMVRNYDRWQKAEVYTDMAPTHIIRKFTTKADETPYIIKEPEHLVVARKELESIPYHDDIYVIEATATTVVESWYVQVKVDGISYVSSTQAVLSGMYSSNLIATDTRVAVPEATSWFDLEKGEDKGTAVVCAIFNTFGPIPDVKHDLMLTFEVVRTDGYKMLKSMDISELFKTENATKRHWLLIDEMITVRPPESSSGGFDPKVDDWEDESQDIEI